MSLFNKKKQGSRPGAESNNVVISSIIGKGMTIVGDLNFSGKLKLDGKVEGNIKGEHLIISDTGNVNGDILIDTCSCQGNILGNVKAKDLNVIKGCRIDGKVTTVNLSVEFGAVMNGEVKILDKDLRLIKNSSQVDEDQDAVVQATS